MIMSFKQRFISIISDWRTVSFFLFMVAGTFVMSNFSLQQRADTSSEVVFFTRNMHDALWHVALSEELNQRLPSLPMNPLLEGVSLRGYHYLTDVLLVIAHRLTGLSFLFLYLRVTPLLLASALAATTWWLFYRVFKFLDLVVFGATLAIIGSGFAYLTPMFFPVTHIQQSVFWLDQSPHMGINQQLMLGLIICNLIWLMIYQSTKKYWMLIGVLTGVLVMIKVYLAAVLLPAIGLVGVFYFVRHRQITLLKASFVAGVVAVCGILLIGSQSEFPFQWHPGWFFKTMFEAGDRLNFPTWELIRLEAVFQQSLHRLIILWGGAMAIFFAGNFGVKILGILALPILIKKIDTDKGPFWLILGLVVFFSLMIPSLVIQKGVVWNSVQFLHAATIPLTLLLTLRLQNVSFVKLRSLLLLVLFIISLPTTIVTLVQDWQPSSYTTIEAQTISDLRSLRFSHRDKQILLHPHLTSNSLVTAFSGRRVYWADPGALDILLVDDEERKAFQNGLVNAQTACHSGQIWLYPFQNRILVEECPLVPICYP